MFAFLLLIGALGLLGLMAILEGVDSREFSSDPHTVAHGLFVD
jgi:hypothetical protein